MSQGVDHRLFPFTVLIAWKLPLSPLGDDVQPDVELSNTRYTVPPSGLSTDQPAGLSGLIERGSSHRVLPSAALMATKPMLLRLTYTVLLSALTVGLACISAKPSLVANSVGRGHRIEVAVERAHVHRLAIWAHHRKVGRPYGVSPVVKFQYGTPVGRLNANKASDVERMSVCIEGSTCYAKFLRGQLVGCSKSHQQGRKDVAGE